MKIAFCCQHPYYGGLNNNGGSLTIINSSKVLNRLGHKAVIVTKSDKCNWIDHKKSLRYIPRDVDVCIACSVSDIRPMLKSKPEGAKAFWWCRLLETYQKSKSIILRRASKVNVLVNSMGLYNWFKNNGIEARVVYQGYDHKWGDLHGHDMKVIGFLVSSKKRKHFDFIEEIVKSLGAEYSYYGFGSDLNGGIKKFVKNNFKKFIRNADYNDLICLYNKVGIWVSTSTNEGLHNCPLEAALCGCAVVYPGAALAGCSDYCNEETAWRYVTGDINSVVKVIRSVNQSKIGNHKDFIRSNIGDRKMCMQKLITILKKE
jgi:hypothetical protein